MRNYFSNLLLIVFLFTVVASCDNSQAEENRGQIILSSAFDFSSSSVNGYNFELKLYSRFPSIGGPLPDIIVDKYVEVGGDIQPGFTSPSNNSGFALIAESGSMNESIKFFEEYEEFDQSVLLSPSTDTVRLNQVWVLKTSQNKYVKLNIRDIKMLTNVSGDFLELRLDYYYQDDGTPLFPE